MNAQVCDAQLESGLKMVHLSRSIFNHSIVFYIKDRHNYKQFKTEIQVVSIWTPVVSNELKIEQNSNLPPSLECR